MTAETRKRLARNQALFRELNERIMDMCSNGEAVEFVCECSDPECATTVLMSPDDYEHVRAASVRFLVIPGHEVLEIERVVSREDGYVTVENRVHKDYVEGDRHVLERLEDHA
jgi:hypothetical protein